VIGVARDLPKDFPDEFIEADLGNAAGPTLSKNN